MGHRTRGLSCKEFRQRAEDYDFDVQSKRRLEEAIDRAVEHEREECAKVAVERDNYWSTVAYDQRQAGKKDIDASARAGSAMVIASAIRARTQVGQYQGRGK